MSQVQLELNGNRSVPCIHARKAENVSWRGRPALLLDGLAFFPDRVLDQGTITVDIGAEGATYCGIVFHGQDPANFELVYAQPHTSGRWDALQYDPVFHGSNTWQLYHGPGAQQSAKVPTGEWFTLEVAFGEREATVRIGDEPPLVISRLAHRVGSGFIGIWSYLPAYFANLRFAPEKTATVAHEGAAVAKGLIDEWFVEGYGRVACEDNGMLNLNRYLPVTLTEARLTRRLVAERKTQVRLTFGFSDTLKLALDDQALFEGEHLFRPKENNQGYVGLDQTLEWTLPAGEHILSATLGRAEYFGWGMIMALQGEDVRLLPAAIG